MKRLLLVFVLGLALSLPSEAQNNQGKAGDASRIALAPVVDDLNIPTNAKGMLESKMRQMCVLNGLSGEGENPLFSIKATIDVLSKELTATAPVMHSLVLTINMFVVDNSTGNVFSQTSIDVKGAGQNESKAYASAIKNLDPKKGQFKTFITQGQAKIIEFYNSQCDFVISRAQALKEQGRDGDASALLYSVPTVCKECYDQCMQLAGTMNAVNVADVPQSETEEVAENTEMEVEKGIFVLYKECNRYGQKIRLTFSIENRNDKDYEFEFYWKDARLIDGEGNDITVSNTKIAGKDNSYLKATILNDTPVTMECEFDAVDQVKMFEIKKDGNIFRMRLNINCQ